MTIKWFSNSDNKKSSTTINKANLTAEKVLEFDKEVKKLGKYFIFLKDYVQKILNTEPEIEEEIKKLISRTKRDLKKEYILRELLILRYSLLHMWFFDIKPPQNQNEVAENFVLIDRAIQSVLESNNKSDYLIWLEKGFADFFGTNELEFSKLDEFKASVIEKVSEKMTLIPFESTGGSFSGELHDGVLKLLMETIEKDKKSYYMDDRSITHEEKDEIKTVIRDISTQTHEDAKSVLEDMLNEMESTQ